MNAIDSIRWRRAILLFAGFALFAADWTSPAVALTQGALVKGNGPAVYFISADKMRHAFPNQAVFDSWYLGSKANITKVTDQELSALPLGKNIVFRPGVKLIKITTNPKVYAVSRYGIIHWVTTEALARELYGTNWNKSVVDVSDAFFTNYVEGTPIFVATDYNRSAETASAVSPQSNLSMPQSESDGWMTIDQKNRTLQIVSLLENNTTNIQYGYAENLDDGRGYTVGRAGFTTATGDAYLVVQRYAILAPKNALTNYLPRLKVLADAESDNVIGLEGFPAAWSTAAADPLFRQAQDEIVDEVYYVPAMQAADALDIKTALGRAIIFDTIIQHGGGDNPDSLSALIARTTTAQNGTPATGKKENDWLRAFLQVRRADLAHAFDPTTREAWALSVDRLDVWTQILNAGNSNLTGPININTSSYQAKIK